MNRIEGKRISVSFFSAHQWVEDIAYYEGPLISFIKGSTTQDYFYYWLDSSISVNRWLIIPVSRDDIDEYKNKNISLLGLTQSSEQLYTVDIDIELKYKNAMQTTYDDLHEDYIPSEDSYFNEDLCPAGHNIFKTPQSYKLAIDGEWFFDDLIKLPKKYIELYAFSYTLFNVNKPNIADNARNIFSHYPWKGGFSTVNFFRDLNKIIPSMHEPRIKSFQYASPGNIDLELDSDVSKFLADIIKNAENNYESLEDIEKETSKFLKNNAYSKIPEDQPLPKLPAEHKKFLRDAHKLYSEFMGIDTYNADMLSFSKNELISIKIIRSIFRRLKPLIEYKNKNMIRY